MTTAIATQLQSITDTTTIELSSTSSDWQAINEVVEQERQNQPVYLVLPQTTAALGEVIKRAAQQQWRILLCGNGTKINWGKTARDIQLVVSLQKCDRLIEHAVGDLTVTVEAGMKLTELQTILAAHNQFLPLDTNYPDATLGGIVATADAGSWRQRYGGVRDLLLGLSFVRGDGKVAKAGGRVVKNVAGYDLMKLFTGAYGTLGVITQLTFRTYPLVSTTKTLLLTGKASAIAKITQSIRNSGLTPTAMDLLAATVIERLGFGSDMGLMMRWQTIPASIEQQISEVKAIAKTLELNSQTYTDESAAALWQNCTKMMNIPESEQSVTCKLGIAPAAAVEFLDRFGQESILGRIHASSGLGKIRLSPKPAKLAQIRTHCQENQGFLTILDAPQAVKQALDVWGYAGNGHKTMLALKNQFDPQNIFNPGRFIV
ncbi:MAG: FAD-binding oxidoreductase [Cyanobacteria bacterium J06623_7]